MLDLDLKNIWTVLLDLDWLFDILDLELKNTRTTELELTLLNTELINQAEMWFTNLWRISWIIC